MLLIESEHKVYTSIVKLHLIYTYTFDNIKYIYIYIYIYIYVYIYFILYVHMVLQLNNLMP